jgi:hypothetical protein
MSLASGDLTTLATAQAYLTSSPGAVVLPGLISRTSRWILNEIRRPFILPKTYTLLFSGTGQRQLVLPYWPVLSISSLYNGCVVVNESSNLIVNGVVVPYTPTYGWRIQAWDGIPPGDPAVIALYGGPSFDYGTDNINITFRAGYIVSGEAATVPAATGPYTVTPLQPYGTWASNEGVTYANGTALVAKPVGTSLIAGQYIPPAPDLPTPRLTYTFAAADHDAAVLLSYGFVPADLEQVVLEVLSERGAYRQRPGVRSQSLAAQESVTYENRLSYVSQSILDNYKSVLPPPLGVLV